jgi:hypothetical protein
MKVVAFIVCAFSIVMPLCAQQQVVVGLGPLKGGRTGTVVSSTWSPRNIPTTFVPYMALVSHLPGLGAELDCT